MIKKQINHPQQIMLVASEGGFEVVDLLNGVEQGREWCRTMVEAEAYKKALEDCFREFYPNADKFEHLREG